MNERIRELAERADILFYQGRIPETGFEYEGAEVTVEDLKKFTELILRETCAPMIRLVRKADQSGDWKNYPTEVVAMFMYKDLLEYFGIDPTK